MENTNLSVQEKNITDVVLSRVIKLEKEHSIQFPETYSYSNALKSAHLLLQKTLDRNKQPVLQSCTKESICNALLDMVVQGLSPMKNQCYFIAYGKDLQLVKSYLGTIASTKRLREVKDVKAYCIYEGDIFERAFDYDTGILKISKFIPKFENQDNEKILGAFAIIVGYNGILHTEVMTMAQIRKSWNMGSMKGNSGAHKDFTEEMAKKTVINRACKLYVNTSDDSDILINSINQTSSSYEDKEKEVENVKYSVNNEIAENANKKPLEMKIEEVEPVPVKEEVKKEQQQFDYEIEF